MANGTEACIGNGTGRRTVDLSHPLTARGPPRPVSPRSLSAEAEVVSVRVNKRDPQSLHTGLHEFIIRPKLAGKCNKSNTHLSLIVFSSELIP